jgi:hypothetical protein
MGGVCGPSANDGQLEKPHGASDAAKLRLEHGLLADDP